MYIYFNNSLAFEKNIWLQPHFTGYIYSLYQNGNKLRKLMTLKHLSLGNCQEAFNKRLPVCCFGSVRNPLALNIRELRGEACLSRG